MPRAKRDCCSKLKELGISSKNIKRAMSPKGNAARKAGEKAVRSSKINQRNRNSKRR